MNTLPCFKAYDIRGRLPDELNADIAWRIGRAYAALWRPRQVAVGYDIRLSSPALAAAVAEGLMAGGADVLDIGLCCTEEAYFATFHRRLDGGIMVTASHNPADYNGMKLVQAGARPISGDSGLDRLGALAAQPRLAAAPKPGTLSRDHDKRAYLDHLLGYVAGAELAPLTVVADAGNGSAGPVIEALAARLPIRLIPINATPDGHFPNGIPNPLLPENRAHTARAVLDHGADLGLAWDGDADRCFFFDHQGRFVEGYYLVGLLAETLLASAETRGERIVHDPRLVWNTVEKVTAAGGVPVMSKTGHAFIKERMRQEDALYGGEMSAHHYFRDFAYCDSGMIPWLLVVKALSAQRARLADLVAQAQAAYPCSGEINFRVADTAAALAAVREAFACEQPVEDDTDGLSLAFADWRLNLRASNTEPLLRLNIETRADAGMLAERTQQVRSLLERL